jgi:hypothetical protein
MILKTSYIEKYNKDDPLNISDKQTEKTSNFINMTQNRSMTSLKNAYNKIPMSLTR